jgi:hypothetical protein
MSNLVTLCRFHHRKVHEGQVIIQVLDDAAMRGRGGPIDYGLAMDALMSLRDVEPAHT